MNKTIIININGIVFHIEEDAYEVLKSYMTEVKRHFAYSTDNHEIITDIENRLAEMFSEKLSAEGKEVIVLEDVRDITAQMGRPADFDLEEEDKLFETEAALKGSKSLFKDPDDKKIAGVCSGLGHYFGMEAKWVRLIAILLVLSSGIGILPYIILWIILPTANSRQEKMSMRGEPINLQSFKKNFDNEAIIGESGLSVKTSDPLQDIISTVVRIFKLIIKSIGILIVAAGILGLSGMLLGLLFGIGFVNNSGFYHFPFNVVNPEYRSPVILSALLLLVIPLLALIFFAVRVITNRSIVSRYSSFAMLMLWLTGIGMAVYYGSRVAADFKDEAKFQQTVTLQAQPVIRLRLNNDIFFTREDSIRYHIKDGDLNGRVLYGEDRFENETQSFDLYIERSEDSTLSVIKEFSARGRTFEQAFEAAKQIGYQLAQRDSIIQLDKYISLTGDALYRKQSLDVILKVPVNTKLIIERSLRSRLHTHEIWECRDRDADRNEPFQVVMTESGLECALEKPEPAQTY